MANPRISVITPFSGTKYAELYPKVLKTFAHQTLKPTEVVVVSDWDPDILYARLIRPLEAARINLKIVPFQMENMSGGPRKDAGWNACSPDSDFRFFMDADIFHMPDVFERTVRYHNQHPYSLCHGRYIYLTKKLYEEEDLSKPERIQRMLDYHLVEKKRGLGPLFNQLGMGGMQTINMSEYRELGIPGSPQFKEPHGWGYEDTYVERYCEMFGLNPIFTDIVSIHGYHPHNGEIFRDRTVGRRVSLELIRISRKYGKEEKLRIPHGYKSLADQFDRGEIQ